MSDRGTKDEAFIGDAYEGIFSRRDIADQAFYNGYKDDQIPMVHLSTFITAVRIYIKKGILSDQDLDKAEQAKTYGDVRDLVDEFHPRWLASRK